MSHDPLRERMGITPDGHMETVLFGWDQWVVCNITCSHGIYQGESRGFNVTEAFQEAKNEYDKAHP